LESGRAELEWITSQRDVRSGDGGCLCCARARRAMSRRQRARRDDDENSPFIRELAARIEGGFYPNAELGLACRCDSGLRSSRELATRARQV
jgi:hypothetical protein